MRRRTARLSVAWPEQTPGPTVPPHRARTRSAPVRGAVRRSEAATPTAQENRPGAITDAGARRRFALPAADALTLLAVRIIRENSD